MTQLPTWPTAPSPGNAAFLRLSFQTAGTPGRDITKLWSIFSLTRHNTTIPPPPPPSTRPKSTPCAPTYGLGTDANLKARTQAHSFVIITSICSPYRPPSLSLSSPAFCGSIFSRFNPSGKLQCLHPTGRAYMLHHLEELTG